MKKTITIGSFIIIIFLIICGTFLLRTSNVPDKLSEQESKVMTACLENKYNNDDTVKFNWTDNGFECVKEDIK